MAALLLAVLVSALVVCQALLVPAVLGKCTRIRCTCHSVLQGHLAL